MNFKLTPEQARNAVADALESGEYTQGRFALHNLLNDSYCCLGVACDIFCKIEEPLNRKPTDFKSRESIEGYDDCLPLKVQEWLGFTTKGGNFAELIHDKGSLVALNDRTDLGFKFIATLFRNPPKGLCLEEPLQSEPIQNG